MIFFGKVILNPFHGLIWFWLLYTTGMNKIACIFMYAKNIYSAFLSQHLSKLPSNQVLIYCVITRVLSVLLALQNLREFPLHHYNHQTLLRGSLFPEPKLSSPFSFLHFNSMSMSCIQWPEHSASTHVFNPDCIHLHSVADNFLIHARGWIHEKFLKVACSRVLTHHDW